MTLEQALLTAVTAVVGALIYVAKLLWNEAIECKSDRTMLRTKVEKLEADNGSSSSIVALVRKCRTPNCQFADTPPRQA